MSHNGVDSMDNCAGETTKGESLLVDVDDEDTIRLQILEHTAPPEPDQFSICIGQLVPDSVHMANNKPLPPCANETTEALKSLVSVILYVETKLDVSSLLVDSLWTLHEKIKAEELEYYLQEDAEKQDIQTTTITTEAPDDAITMDLPQVVLDLPDDFTGIDKFNFMNADGEISEIQIVAQEAEKVLKEPKLHKMNNGQWNFTCRLCGKTFNKEVSYRGHVREHDGLVPFPCNQCDRGYKLYKSLCEHLTVHQDVQFVCKVCGKSFKKKNLLSTHMRRHDPTKRHKCTVCGKLSVSSMDNTVHMRSHTGEKPYACPICDRRFSSHSGRRTHIGVHSKLKRATCDICGKRLVSNNCLKRHLLKIHHIKWYK